MKAMNNTLTSILIGLAVSAYMYSVYAGVNLFPSERTAFIAFVIIGMAMCSVGIGNSVETVGFSNPLVILGMVFGILNLVIVYTALNGGSLFFVRDYTTATIALGGTMIIKVLIKVLMNFIYALN